MSDRGTIKYRDRARQIRDYSGLRYKNITPTDIDGFMDFGGRAFVVIELKYGDAEVPYGQKLAIERLVDTVMRGGVECVGVIANHNFDVNEDIDAAKCNVSCFRYNNKWITPKSNMSLKEYIDKMRAHWGIE